MCRLGAAICKGKQIWNDDKCRCECKEDLIDEGRCDKGFIWNPSNCECECDKSCGIGQYLDFKSRVCRNSLIDKLVVECTSVIDENKIHNTTFNVTLPDNCTSCTLYVALFAGFSTKSVIICGIFVYFYWYKKINN